MTTLGSYELVGASATKTDVHEAIRNQSRGLYPGAFCKIIDDIAGDPNYCSVVHADGAGTKSLIAYLVFKETKKASVFRGIAQDSAVMNFDDLACVGACSNFILSNTIGRNAHRIPKEVISELIEGYQQFITTLSNQDISVAMAGGETADVGDLVGTIIVDSTVVCRLPRAQVIEASHITAGDVIIGLASFGKTTYESFTNSGIGSNGLTRARHLLLHPDYARMYPETYSPTIPSHLVYQGRYHLEDHLPDGNGMTIGEALLSPTRTYLPFMKQALSQSQNSIHGIIHCSGGGLTKCLNFGNGLSFVKDNLLEPPPLFKTLLDTGHITLKEACQVFNMGVRYELYVDKDSADSLIKLASNFHIEAKVIGEVEAASSSHNQLLIKMGKEELLYKG